MRFSISFVFAAIISFALLVVMTQLVTHDIQLPTTPTSVLDDITLLPPDKPEQSPRTEKLPEKQQVKSAPKVPAIPITAVDNGEIDRSLPRFDPNAKPGVQLSNWPGVDDGNSPTSERGELDGDAPRGLTAISQIQPLYPREQAAKGVQGSVTLRFEVRQDGSVGNVNVLSASPRGAFEAAAIRAVQRWRYRPTEQGPVEQTVTLDFNLEQ